MKLQKGIATLLAFGITFVMSVSAFADTDIPELNSTFTISEEVYPTVTRGTVNHGGLGGEPIDIDDEYFDKVYEYVATSAVNNINGSITFPLDEYITSTGSNDAVYISFYYRSFGSFEWNGTTYYANEKERINHMRHSDSSVNKGMMMRMMGPTGEGGGYDMYGDYMEADNEWHKVEMYTPANGFSAGKNFMIAITNGAPCYIQITGLKVGVLKMQSYNNDQAYTDIGMHLSKMDTKGLIVNGKEVPVEEGVNEYTISSNDDNIDVKLAEGSNTYIKNIEKLGAGKYEVTVASNAYDPTISDKKSVKFRTRYNNGTYTGAITINNIRNSELYEKYIINLKLREAEATLQIGGEAAGANASIAGCVPGDTLSVNIDYKNYKAENKEFLVLLVFYKNGGMEKIVSAKEAISSSTPTASKTYEYTLPEGDYSGYTVNYFVLDANGMSEVSK